MKLGHRRKDHNGRAALVIYANISGFTISFVGDPAAVCGKLIIVSAGHFPGSNGYRTQSIDDTAVCLFSRIPPPNLAPDCELLITSHTRHQ